MSEQYKQTTTQLTDVKKLVQEAQDLHEKLIREVISKLEKSSISGVKIQLLGVLFLSYGSCMAISPNSTYEPLAGATGVLLISFFSKHNQQPQLNYWRIPGKIFGMPVAPTPLPSWRNQFSFSDSLDQ